MRYISTRGAAPTLGFSDILLAGLADDGGLYVPESWPRLAAGGTGIVANSLWRRRALLRIEVQSHRVPEE